MCLQVQDLSRLKFQISNIYGQITVILSLQGSISMWYLTWSWEMYVKIDDKIITKLAYRISHLENVVLYILYAIQRCYKWFLCLMG